MFDGYNGIPASYDYINVRNSMFKPSTVHVKQTGLASYFQRYLIQKIISAFKFEGLPDYWAKNYFYYVLFVFGFIGVIYTDKYGAIPQHGTLAGRNVMYQPNKMIIANPLLGGTKEPIIGKQCALIKMQPDYGGAWDIVEFYADMLALSAESAATNLINSKLAYIFATDSKAGAESFKKMVDQILSGNPAAFVDKSLFKDDGSPSWVMFNQNLQQNYIAGDILQDMAMWDARFNTEVGIPNVGIAKLSGVSPDEVNANNGDTTSKVSLWLETMQEGIRQCNDLFGTDISVSLRYGGGEQDGAVLNNDALQLRSDDI